MLRIDPQRLVMVGQSMGGFLAAHTAAERLGILGNGRPVLGADLFLLVPSIVLLLIPPL